MGKHVALLRSIERTDSAAEVLKCLGECIKVPAFDGGLQYLLNLIDEIPHQRVGHLNVPTEKQLLTVAAQTLHISRANQNEPPVFRNGDSHNLTNGMRMIGNPVINQESAVAESHRSDRRPFGSLRELSQPIWIMRRLLPGQQFRRRGQCESQLSASAETRVERDFLRDCNSDGSEWQRSADLPQKRDYSIGCFITCGNSICNSRDALHRQSPGRSSEHHTDASEDPSGLGSAADESEMQP